MTEEKNEFRTEKDSMGEMQVPTWAYYAAQTQRAVENFPISGIGFSRPMIAALGTIKFCAAETNHELGELEQDLEKAILAAAQEVIDGKLDKHFVVDIFQTGSGTSSNMNSNEVIANRAKEIVEGAKNIHPNDHVNMSQSSNDVIPTAIHIATATDISKNLIPALKTLEKSLLAKSTEFDGIVKTGRTHLMDATPITLGQEFSGYAAQITQSVARLERSLTSVFELPLGGTAVGTGLNTPVGFSEKTIARIAKRSSLPFVEATNHFEAQASRDALVEISGQLKTIACSMAKIANDIRWLSSGPRCGIGELTLPSIQPGSSIMPGKVNPVISESVMMVAAQVVGNDATVTTCGFSGGSFELNVMMPVMAHNVLQSIELLTTSATNFAGRCIDGIVANVDRLNELAELSLATCTSLAPIIGYDKAAALAKEAFKTGETIRQICQREKVLPEAELNRALDLLRMTKPGL